MQSLKVDLLEVELGWPCMPKVPALGTQRQENYSKFEAMLDYIVQASLG